MVTNLIHLDQRSLNMYFVEFVLEGTKFLETFIFVLQGFQDLRIFLKVIRSSLLVFVD
jgi:hypothetical protein